MSDVIGVPLQRWDGSSLSRWDETDGMIRWAASNRYLRSQKTRLHSSPARTISDFEVLPALDSCGFPGLSITRGTSLDEDALHFVRSMHDSCSEKGGDGRTEEGYLRNGLEPPSAFGPLRALMSHATSLTLPPLWSSEKTSKFEGPAHAAIFAALCERLFSSSVAPTDILHPKRGTTSFPEWSASRDRKQEILSRILPNLVEVRDMIRQGRWDVLDGDWSLYNVTFLQTRRQPESPEKVRQLVTRSTLQSGETEPADKSIPEAGPFWGRARLRLVYALNAAINWPFSTYQLYPFMKQYMDRFDYAYKQRGRGDLTRKLNRGRAISVDVAQFDSNTPNFLVARFFEAFANRVGEEWSYPSAVSYTSVLTCPPSGGADSSLLQLGHPMTGTLPYGRGIPSGHSANVPLGRVVGTFLMLSALHDLGLFKLEEIDGLLSGSRDDLQVLNSSDDAAFIVRDQGAERAIRAYFGSNESPYFDTEMDDYFQYLGFVGSVDDKGHLSATNKASSYLINMLAPERSTRSHFRSFPWTGFASREELYSADGSQFTWEIQECFQRRFRETYSLEWLDVVRTGQASEGVRAPRWADKVFLANPDAIHYLITPDQLSPPIRDATGLTMSGEYLAKFYPHIF